MLQAFLDDIVAHPDDPSLWLILADWLEERDDPRGELVRLTRAPRIDDGGQARVQALLAAGVEPVVPRLAMHGFDFVWVPPGRFLLGSPVEEDYRDDDEARHPVTITAGFWIGVGPVTQGQWRAVMGNNPSAFSRDGTQSDRVRNVPDDALARFPVESVTWDDVPRFRERAGQLLGRAVRLPTEAEWEYAARAGTTTPFPFGPTLNGVAANCDGTTPYGTKRPGPYRGRPTPVGSYPPNAWGLVDAIGNVGEWVRDAFRRDYEALPPTDPVWEEDDPRRVVFRGGSWDRNPIYCRAAYRNHIGPRAATNNIGFRIVLGAVLT